MKSYQVNNNLRRRLEQVSNNHTPDARKQACDSPTTPKTKQQQQQPQTQDKYRISAGQHLEQTPGSIGGEFGTSPPQVW